MANDPYERELLRLMEEARRDGERLLSEAAGLEKALAAYRRLGTSYGPEIPDQLAGATTPASGPTPPEGWKGLSREIVEKSPKPLDSSDVLRVMALRGYGHANPKTITSTLSSLAREGVIISDKGRYSGRAATPVRESEAAGAHQDVPAAPSSPTIQEDRPWTRPNLNN